ncbi:Protein bicaudal C like 1 [Pseudolycoriella hygida]|uniref:Protein bicaudal C like 1 n=1 Tax=Pseudolycoriella hygida TaxID=35572 RepID=A0A9Q0NBV0_9DIPT|nr:Protein bicaudal C like 1 [Pseudolycoriella hygida]
MYMYPPRLRSIHSPLTPIPPMNQTAFDFSPSTIKLYLEQPRKQTPALSKERRTCTPLTLDLPTPNLSPIEDFTIHANAVSSRNTSFDSSSSLLNDDDTLEYDDDVNQQSLLNLSNINNHHMDMATVLQDIGLEQYGEMFETEEIDLMAFLLLSDTDLEELGINDRDHREVFMDTIEKLNNKN